MLYEIFIGGLVGIVFGFVLEKSKVFEASIIIDQLLFKRFIMLKVFMSAVIVSTVILFFMNYIGIFVFKIKDFNWVSNILGGGLLGVGIAMSGACPGTVFAQIGVGYKDAFFTFLGGLVAAYGYCFWGSDIVALFSPWNLGKVRLDDVIGVSPLLSISIVIILVFLLVLFEKIQPWRDELSKKE